jgi:hypothetical protein
LNSSMTNCFNVVLHSSSDRISLVVCAHSISALVRESTKSLQDLFLP